MVNTYRGPEGDERIWFEPEEIETATADALRDAGLMPTTDSPVTDIERFIETHLGAKLDQYAELPEGVMGLTLFHPTEIPFVKIDNALTEAADAATPKPGALGRWRATMAHEATHVMLHRHLFAEEFSGPARSINCSEKDVLQSGSANELARSKKGSDWREVQANMGMAALLMPARLFKRIARQEVAKLSMSTPVLHTPGSEALAAAIAERCNVSRQAAHIRLETLKICRAS